MCVCETNGQLCVCLLSSGTNWSLTTTHSVCLQASHGIELVDHLLASRGVDPTSSGHLCVFIAPLDSTFATTITHPGICVGKFILFMWYFLLINISELRHIRMLL